jgi:predicted Rossmann fold flavoprotein
MGSGCSEKCFHDGQAGKSMIDVAVVGAGAAGIIAAWRAATLGKKVVLLEKTNRIGTKILISGGGKCNITHDGPIEDVLRAFRPHEARFIRPACYRFINRQIVEMLTSRGLEVYTRPDGRIFPVHQTAKDVVAILRRYLVEAGVDLRLETPVKRIACADGKVIGVELESESLDVSKVILATGGSSYPNSGTTGDGWPWARELGHSIVPVRAALAPIYLHEGAAWSPELSGIALRDIVLKARQNGKEVERWRGDLLFTHHGISGPCALGISRVVTEKLLEGEVTLEVDLKPDSSPEEVQAWAMAYVQAHPKRQIASMLDEEIPERLIAPLFESAKADPGTVIAQFDRKSRNRLVEAVKRWELGKVRTVPLEKGECVAGGVNLDEVDPQTMRSLKCQGLYLCGEVLDIAGPVGGYNLQSAFATGFVAGETAAND